MPLPDGRTIPEPVEVASLPFDWLVGLSANAAASTAIPQVSAVGYYDAQGGADGAPTEIQVVARAAGGTIAVITARVHRANARSRFVFRNTRSVVLPLGQVASSVKSIEAETSRKGKDATDSPAVAAAGFGSLEGTPHPNLPLIARLGRNGDRNRGGLAVEVHSWVNGGSHLQCIPCKPTNGESGQLGHTAGAHLGHMDTSDSRRGAVVRSESMMSDGSSSTFSFSSGCDGKEKDRVAPVFSELAQKVRSGDELSFVPYALPSLTLGCTRCNQQTRAAEASQVGLESGVGVAATCGAGGDDALNGGEDGQEDIKHAMWLADWIGAEALPPALAVIDEKSRLHVYELDDGASSEAPTAEDTGECADVVTTPVGGNYFTDAHKWASGKSVSSVMSLSHSERHLHMKGLEDTKEADLSPERMSRRARAEYDGGASSFKQQDYVPLEKTVVLPLDSKYGLGLTLAFEGSRVSERLACGMGNDLLCLHGHSSPMISCRSI